VKDFELVDFFFRQKRTLFYLSKIHKIFHKMESQKYRVDIPHMTNYRVKMILFIPNSQRYWRARQVALLDNEWCDIISFEK